MSIEPEFIPWQFGKRKFAAIPCAGTVVGVSKGGIEFVREEAEWRIVGIGERHDHEPQLYKEYGIAVDSDQFLHYRKRGFSTRIEAAEWLDKNGPQRD